MSDTKTDGKYYLKISLPGLPPGGNSRTSWRGKYKNTMIWKRAVWAAVAKAHKPEKPLEKVRLKFTRCSVKLMDWDNLVISFKPIQDGLVEAGVMIDDTIEVIPEMPIYEQKKGRQKRGYVNIEVWAI